MDILLVRIFNTFLFRRQKTFLHADLLVDHLQPLHTVRREDVCHRPATKRAANGFRKAHWDGWMDTVVVNVGPGAQLPVGLRGQFVQGVGDLGTSQNGSVSSMHVQTRCHGHQLWQN